MRVPLRTVLAGLSAVLFATQSASGQSVVDRTPNLSGGWLGSPGRLYFNFLHRFSQSGAPQRKVTSSPTFLLAAPVHERLLLGARYATNSDLVARVPNEWEFLGRVGLLSQERGSPLDLAVQGGYNLAAQSVDGELALARRLGPVRVLAAGRAFSNAFDAGEARYAAAGGASLRLSGSLSVAGDIAVLLDREEPDDEPVAWGAGIQWALPYTPHTLSLHATSANTASLEGASRGAGRVRYGFEFTIPITIRRFLPTSEPPVAAPGAAAAFAGADTVRIAIRDVAYQTPTVEVPVGTTIVWTNEDPVVHTVTAEDGSFDSGDMPRGAAWSRTFDQPGTYAYICTPHPFMKATVIVR